MICQNCGSEVMDGLNVCPSCGMMIQAPGYGNNQQPYGAAPQNNYGQPQAPYGQPQGGYNQPMQGGYQQGPYGNGVQGVDPAEKAISTAKTLGIVAIVVGLLCSPLVGWICGGIGLSKAGNAPAYLEDKAKSAKTLCIVGIVCATVSFLIGIILVIAAQNM